MNQISDRYCYFPPSIVQPLVEEGRLCLVPDAPHFERAVYCVYPVSIRQSAWIAAALNVLRRAGEGGEFTLADRDADA